MKEETKKTNINRLKIIISKNKPIIFLITIMLLATVGGTFAVYYKQYIREINFNLADYSIVLEEYFPITEWDEDKILEKQVRIINNGTANVFLRVSYNEIWYNGDDIVNNMHNGIEIVDKKWTTEFINDFEYSDGWYYYKKLLSKGDSVTILNSVEKVVDVYNEETNHYELDFNYEVLQSDNSASEKVWGEKATIEGSRVIWEF